MTTRQKPWDIHEAVILLDGLLEIMSDGVARNDIVKRVSDDLRMMAVNRGETIDDIFRNVSGITFQLKSMESAYAGHTIMKPASKLFTETVAIYRDNPVEYKKLREEATEMIHESTTVEKKFKHYLASQVSSGLVAEFTSYYPDIEDFCLKVRVLKKPLFETTELEVIKQVQRTVEQNKIFRMTHKKNYVKMVSACRYYYVFIRDGLFNDTAVENDAEKTDQSIIVSAASNPPAPVNVYEAESKPESLEELVREALRAETEGNNYGTTISFLQGHVRNGDRATIKAILDSADWAKLQFGRYFYVKREVLVPKVAEAPSVEEKQEVQLTRTDEDKRLLQKYPIIYKRLFSSLFELSATQTHGVSVAELYSHISRIGRPAVIEEILDNVSWAVISGNKYLFSAEIVGHQDATNDFFTVDFNSANELAYTKPVSFTYFGEEKNGYSSWTDLYVAFFATMYEDYPHIFSRGMSFSKNKGRIELTGHEAVGGMIAPKPVPGTSYFIETNISASDIIPKIKFIMDLCNVDYENVVIKYKKKESAEKTKRDAPGRNETTITSPALTGRVASDSFSAYLSRTLKMAERTAYNYALAIGVCESIAKAQGYTKWRLYSEDRASVLETIHQLKSDPMFIERNSSRHNQLTAALAKFVQFIDVGGCLPSVKRADDEPPITNARVPYKNEPYEAVLKDHFKKGFRLESPLEIRKFKRYYSALHNAELADADDVIADTIKRLCIIYDGKAFLPAVMLSEELKQRLLHYIDKCFAEGKTAIYYQAIYTEFADEFLDYHIYEAEMLKAYLTYIADGRFYINRSSISMHANVTLDPLSEIRSCLQGYGRPVEYEELFAALPHLPQDKVKFILASNGEFVNNGHGAYFHESVIVLSDEELDNIADIIASTIEEKDFIGGNELYDAIKAKYPYIIESNLAYSVYGFRDALKYKLGERFSFKGNIISRAGRELSMADVFANYARNHDSFSLSELQALASELATPVYYESVYENSLRISQDRFIAKSHAQFSVADTDAALDRVCTGSYISLQSVTNFGIFPYAGFPWNSYLLEHYVAEYSRKYMLLHSNFNGTECAGAIVKRSAGIQTFDDFIVDLLANNDVELKKAPVLQFLSDQGYLARRRYGRIESLIIKASAQRNRKDTD